MYGATNTTAIKAFEFVLDFLVYQVLVFQDTVPKTIYSDQGSEFQNASFQSYWTDITLKLYLH